MGYTYEKQEDNYGLLKEGEYEVRIERVEQKTTNSGKEKLAIMFRVRDDVEQDHNNRVLFEDIWKERDTEFYNRKRLNQLLGTQHLEDGTSFNSIDDIIKVLSGANLIVVVNTRFNEYYDKEENGISYYKSSNHLPKALTSTGITTKENLDKIEIADEDLPF